MLPAADQAFLNEKRYEWRETTENGMICVVISNYRLTPGLNHESAELLIRLPPSWPDGKPDMFWVIPNLRKAGANTDPQSTCQEAHLGRTWQRFSRHIASWPRGHGLREWMAVVRLELEKVAA